MTIDSLTIVVILPVHYESESEQIYAVNVEGCSYKLEGHVAKNNNLFTTLNAARFLLYTTLVDVLMISHT